MTSAWCRILELLYSPRPVAFVDWEQIQAIRVLRSQADAVGKAARIVGDTLSRILELAEAACPGKS